MQTKRHKEDKPPHPVAFAQRLLQEQYAIIRKNEPGVRSEDVAALHDFRVALRRFRALLRTFHPLLTETSAEEIMEKATQLSRRLGPSRDLQVWIKFLKSRPIRKLIEDKEKGPGFLRRQENICRQSNLSMIRLLEGPFFHEIKTLANQLLRKEIPAQLRQPSNINLNRFAKRSIQRALNRVSKRAQLKANASSDELHQLRIATRRARYVTEFFGGPLGPTIRELALRLKAVQDGLGRVHDMDTWHAHARGSTPQAPQALLHELLRRRNKGLKQFQKAWKHLHKTVFQNRLKKALSSQ